MEEDSVHKPELPGVRTLQKDAPDEKPSFSFGGIKLTTPERSDTATDEVAVHSGGRLSGGKETFDVERAFNDESIQEGTIVTDRKRKHIGAGAMLKSAWSEWWGNTKNSVETTVDKMEFLKPKERPTVEVAEKRANVLQEAAQYARQVPRDDHAIVVEKVRTYAHDAATATGKPFTIKEPAVKIGAHWSQPREEEKKSEPDKVEPLPTLDLRATTVAHDVQHASTPLTAYVPHATTNKKIETPTPVVTEKPLVASMRTPEKMRAGKAEEKRSGWMFFKDERTSTDVRKAVAMPRPEVTAIPRVDVRQSPSTPRVREAIPVTRPLPPPPAVTTVAPIPRTVTTTPVVREPMGEREEKLSEPRIESRPIIPERSGFLASILKVPRVLIISSIVVVGGGLGVLAALFILNTKEDLPVAPTITANVPSFIRTDDDIPLPLSSTRTVLYQALENEMRADHGTVVQYYPTITESATTRPASTDAIMRTLSWGVPGSFVRVLDSSMMFGSVRGGSNEPFIILSSTNFDVAFAGLLSWEATMSADLAPFFGEPVNGRFTDAITSNRSIRVLRDEAGKERLIYAFVNKNLIVITTTTDTLGAIIGRVQ
jgi:hypothetical protein